ncbi:hypothetical protein BaLi_c12480 [Bacillus paralicheniformis ATCC 9945a]|nr:hypothetical protein BaLi_c12480 [Bacillus paralicheniformis ATCC 9945a]
MHNIPDYIAVGDVLHHHFKQRYHLSDSLMTCCKRIHRFKIWRPVFIDSGAGLPFIILDH